VLVILIIREEGVRKRRMRKQRGREVGRGLKEEDGTGKL
jgi:hypothetical protein